MTAPAPVRGERLRGIELFTDLTDAQLEWLTAVTEERVLADGDTLFHDGDEATHFYVLLDDELLVTKTVDGREELLTRHRARADAGWEHDGKPPAAHRFTGELALLTDGAYVATAVAAGRTTVAAYPKQVFLDMLVRCPGVARVLLPVLAWRIASSEAQARGRATVTAMGTLAAGLAHELNNPAAAVARAARQLGPATDRLAAAARRWGAAAVTREAEALDRLAVEIGRTPPIAETDPVASADLEDEVLAWAERQGVAQPVGLACAMAERGLGTGWLSVRLRGLCPGVLPGALEYLSALLDVRTLTGELRTAGPRISALVAAARDYANLGRAPQGRFSVVDGIEATLAMLRPKLAGVRVVREYAPDLPEASGHPTELNQVWTNLIDNAVDAMAGAGTLTVRTGRQGTCLTVEIGDTGCGIPADALTRIFEPFYTTKDVGKGMGLGLHLAYRIVTQRHHGSLTARSAPGDTWFTVRIPAPTRKDLE
ncbi:ATP-binding protein [Kitasatospora cathayae]|uniref:histidine kinase n=1 Tax=Kitasatospora cathayae TaxID=3004092 RepID=A0ABY7PYV5_9ACTN|nr:ATP-binding protein [Kitasatospora sp. HUAS 3-15]WBP85131.1 ATP-binding protein [Kitasatospora sp. HUAS 3-15]